MSKTQSTGERSEVERGGVKCCECKIEGDRDFEEWVIFLKKIRAGGRKVQKTLKSVKRYLRNTWDISRDF